MSGVDEEDASESSEAEEASAAGGGASEGPPAWWRPTPPPEVAPHPALAEAAEALRKADLLLFVAGEAPPEVGFQALRWLLDVAPIGSALIVPTKGQWVERGWPAEKISELQPPGMTEQDADAVQAAVLTVVIEGVLSNLTRLLSANLVCLDIAGEAATESLRKEIASMLADLPGSVIVTLGTRAPGASAAVTTAVQHLRVPLEQGASLEWIERDLARTELASFIVFDTFMTTPQSSETLARENAAEVLMPRDSSMLRVWWKACTEFGERACPNIFIQPPFVAVAIYSIGARNMVEPSSPMPWQLFSHMGALVPLTCMLMVGSDGLRLPGRNARMLERRTRVVGIFQEMIRKFSSEEYQTKLAVVRDQKELREMIKAVHMTILPKFGFPLTAQSGLAETITMQTRMQGYLYTGILDFEDGVLGNASLQLSGGSKLPTLPFRYKAKPSSALGSLALPGVPVFKPYSFPNSSIDDGRSLLFGGWFGWRRVPAFFISANADDMADYLRSDPDGPFAGRLDDWPETGKLLPTDSRWHRWGFVEDAKEAVLKTDWHALPRFEDTAELFVPRRARRDDVAGAPPRFMAFAEAFRAANRGCWEKLAEALMSLKSTHEASGSKIWKERGGSGLVDEVIQSFKSHGLFGIIEAQVWWGDGPLVLPSHKDGATSLLHLSLTLGGTRTLRLGLFRSMLAGGDHSHEIFSAGLKEPDDPEAGKVVEDVWDNRAWQSTMASCVGVLEDVRMARGNCYISQPYCFEHGVRYETGSQGEPVIALQCRFAFEPELGKKLNGRRDSAMWEISNAIAKTLQAAAERGEVRMPTVEEVKQMQERLASKQDVVPAEVPATVSPGPSPVVAAAPAATLSQAAVPSAAAQPAGAPPKEPESEADRDWERHAREMQDWKREKDLIAKKDKAFKEAAKERERMREKARLERAKGGEDDPCSATDAACTEEVQITIRHGQKGGQVVVTVPGCATMLEVKKALVQKIGRGLVRKVQLVKEKGNTFEAYKDEERLCGRRQLVMLGLALAEAKERLRRELDERRAEGELRRAEVEAERRRREEAARHRREEREENARVARARRDRQEQEAQERLACFLEGHGFTGPRDSTRKRFRITYPLHVAVKQNDAGMVQLLLQANADPSQRDSSGKTPQELARRLNRHGSHEKVLSMLAAL